MSDSLREDIQKHIDMNTFKKNEDGSVEIDAAGLLLTLSEALSAPQADAEAVAWRIRVVDGSYCKVIPDGELEAWKQNWSHHLQSGHAVLEPLGVIGTTPPSQSAEMRKELEVLHKHCHKAVFLSASMIPDNHERALLDRIAARIDAHFNIALSRADEGKESEGGGQDAPAKCSATGVHPTDTSCTAEPEVAPGPSDPTPTDPSVMPGCSGAGAIDREAIARLLTTAKLLLQNAIGCATNHYAHDCELNGLPRWLAGCDRDIKEADRVLALLRGGA